MKLAMIGLGRMGMGMTRRLLAGQHTVVAYDVDEERVGQAEEAGAVAAYSLEEMVGKLDESPRVVWVMLPSDDPVVLSLQELVTLLGEGDIIVEGGNSHYKETIERATMLRYRGIHMLDVGVSSGVWGEHYGYNLAVGGEESAFQAVTPVLEALAPENGYGYVGPSGAGHFVAMVHNGIRQGTMQAIAEGFELLAAKPEFDLDPAALGRLWSNGSAIRSWLLELAANALEEDPNLDWVEPYVPAVEEEHWAVMEATALSVPLPVLTLALQTRFRSRQEESYTARLLAALHARLGGRGT